MIMSPNALRDPILKTAHSGKKLKSIPDISYEISEQELNGEAAGGTPTIVVATLTVVVVSISAVVSAAQGNPQGCGDN